MEICNKNLNGEEIVETFYEKELKKQTNQRGFRIEKVIKKHGDELYMKWKGYDTFQDHIVILKTKLKLNYICLIMQRNLTLKHVRF